VVVTTVNINHSQITCTSIAQSIPVDIMCTGRLVSSGRASLDNLRSMLLVGDPNSEPALIRPGYELTRQLAPRSIECCIRRLYAYDTLLTLQLFIRISVSMTLRIHPMAMVD